MVPVHQGLSWAVHFIVIQPMRVAPATLCGFIWVKDVYIYIYISGKGKGGLYVDLKYG